MAKKRFSVLAGTIGLLCILQLLLYGIKQAIFCIWPRTLFCDRMASLAGMLLLTAVALSAARKMGWKISFLPRRFGGWYFAALAAYAVLLIAAPFLTQEGTAEAWLLLLYSSVGIPLYEEIVFRGILWERLAAVFPRGWQVYLINAGLFALWHFGYWDSIAFRAGAEAVSGIMLWKAITGLCFGLILGLLRLRTKNAFSTALLHGAMNLFAR